MKKDDFSFLPDDKKYYRSSYEDLDFAWQTQWDDFLKIMLGV